MATSRMPRSATMFLRSGRSRRVSWRMSEVVWSRAKAHPRYGRGGIADERNRVHRTMRDVSDDLADLRRRHGEANGYLRIDAPRARPPPLEVEASRPDL